MAERGIIGALGLLGGVAALVNWAKAAGAVPRRYHVLYSPGPDMWEVTLEEGHYTDGVASGPCPSLTQATAQALAAWQSTHG